MKKFSLAVYTSEKVDFPIEVMDLTFYSKCHLTAFLLDSERLSWLQVSCRNPLCFFVIHPAVL